MTTAIRSAGKETVVGLIADTHGLLRTEVLEAFKGVHLIVHAGDVGREGVLEALGQIAPVRAVRGNVDHGAWARKLPLGELLEIGEINLYVYHGHEKPGIDPVAAGCRVVVRGHSHRPEAEKRGGVLYLNPGSAGPKRFKLPVTVMRLYLKGKDVREELVYLVD